MPLRRAVHYDGRRTMRAVGFFALHLLFSAPVWGEETPAEDPQPAPGNSQPELEDLVNITFKNDARVFAVMAALNAAGFDYERSGKTLSTERQAVRQHLEGLDPDLVLRLETYYESHRRYRDEGRESADYISLALLLSDVPELAFPEETDHLPADIVPLRGFADLVRELYEPAGIAALWAGHLKRYELEVERYRPVLEKLIHQTLRYFRIGPRRVLDRTIIFIPDLLNAKDTVNARNLERIYYVIVGPADDPAENYVALQHEYLHVLIDPLIEKFVARMDEDATLLRLANKQPRLKPEYRDRILLILAESMIESLILRMHPPDDPKREIVEFFRQGLVALPSFYRQLIEYERSGLLSFPAYAELLLQDLDEDNLKEAESAIAAMEESLAEEDRKLQEAQERERQRVERKNRIISLLNEAGKLMAQKQFQEAEQRLDELLREDPGNTNGLFYMAQVSARTGDLQRASVYYERVSESNAPAWVRGLSLVRMGRILASRGSMAEARKRFRQVLTLEGDLKGARKEAAELIEALGPEEPEE